MKKWVSIGVIREAKWWSNNEKDVLIDNINPFGPGFPCELANFAQKSDKVLQKRRVLLGNGIKEIVSIGVIREVKWRSLMQK